MRYGDHSFFQTGVAVPLFSLRSKNSIGIGEFLDLIPFANWAKYCDLNVIQILPVNDTGNESSPYSARSAFALHPVYLNLQVIDGSSDFEDEIKKAKEDFNKELRIDFYKIVTWKRAILRKIFDLHFEKIAADKKLERWIDNNEWVKPYCVYALLKAKHSEASWKDWKTNQHPTLSSIEKLWTKNYKEALFQAWMQFEAEAQFKAAVKAISDLGVKLKGDIPILINEDSADVWFHRDFFSLDDRAGAPPDMFSYSGQNWGFPTYRWNVLADDNYSWWRARLNQASKFYHAYRIDHVLGFFRIWAIPEKETSGILGRFIPSLPISRSTLRAAGFKDETLEYLTRPNYSRDQIAQFLGSATDDMMPKYFEPLGYSHDRFILREAVSSERAIAALNEPKAVKDSLQKLYWNRVFVPASSGDDFYPFWYWYDQPVLRTLPQQEQDKLREIISKNAESQEPLWRDNALKLLSVLANETDMLVCAEDLGSVPHCVPEVLSRLNILSLRVERWARNWDSPFSPYYEAADYPRLSVSTTSCHDSSTLLGLWNEPGFDHNQFWQHLHAQGEAPRTLTPDHVRTIIRHLFSTNSLFSIPPVQDLLALSGRWVPDDPSQERVNIPGTVGAQNWSYRMPCSLEELNGYTALSSIISQLAEERRNRPLWKV